MDVQISADRVIDLQRLVMTHEAELTELYDDEETRTGDLIQLAARAGDELFESGDTRELLQGLSTLRDLGRQNFELDRRQVVDPRTPAPTAPFSVHDLQLVRSTMLGNERPDEWRVLVLRARCGYSWQQIAEELGFQPRHVRSRAQRAAVHLTKAVLQTKLYGCGAHAANLPLAIYGLSNERRRDRERREAALDHCDECSKCEREYTLLRRALELALLFVPLSSDPSAYPTHIEGDDATSPETAESYATAPVESRGQLILSSAEEEHAEDNPNTLAADDWLPEFSQEAEPPSPTELVAEDEHEPLEVEQGSDVEIAAEEPAPAAAEPLTLETIRAATSAAIEHGIVAGLAAARRAQDTPPPALPNEDAQHRPEEQPAATGDELLDVAPVATNQPAWSAEGWDAEWEWVDDENAEPIASDEPEDESAPEISSDTPPPPPEDEEETTTDANEVGKSAEVEGGGEGDQEEPAAITIAPMSVRESGTEQRSKPPLAVVTDPPAAAEAEDPNNRASSRDWRAELDNFMTALDSPPSAVRGDDELSERRTRQGAAREQHNESRRRWLASAAAVLLLMLLLAAGLGSLDNTTSPPKSFGSGQDGAASTQPQRPQKTSRKKHRARKPAKETKVPRQSVPPAPVEAPSPSPPPAGGTDDGSREFGPEYG